MGDQTAFRHRVEGVPPGAWPWHWVSIKKPQVLMEVWYIRSWYPICLSELPEISLLHGVSSAFWDSGPPKKQSLGQGAGAPVRPRLGSRPPAGSSFPALTRRLGPHPAPPPPRLSPQPPKRWVAAGPRPGPGRRGRRGCAGGSAPGRGAAARPRQSGRAGSGRRRRGVGSAGGEVCAAPGPAGAAAAGGSCSDSAPRGGKGGPAAGVAEARRAGEWAGPYLILKSWL